MPSRGRGLSLRGLHFVPGEEREGRGRKGGDRSDSSRFLHTEHTQREGRGSVFWNSLSSCRHWPAGLSVAWGPRLERGRRSSGLLPGREGGGLSQAEPGGVGAGTAGQLAGRGCLRSGHFSQSLLFLFRVALCVAACRSESQLRGEAEPRALGCFSREDSLPPCFRLLSPEPRSEWKPSPNMTSKPPQTTS